MQHARLLAIAMAVFALAGVADAKPKPKQSAKAHIDKATKAHKAGKFDVALTELKAAYELDPQPKLLFAIAQVYAKLDDCPNAIDNYEQFLAKTKDKKKQDVVKQAIAACKAKTPDVIATAKPDDKGDNSDVFRKEKPVEETPPTPPAPAVEATPPPVETTPPSPPVEPASPPTVPDAQPAPPLATQPMPLAPEGAQHKPFYKDVLGDALVVGGVAVGVVSFVEYRGATAKLDDAENATALADYEQNLSDAHDLRRLSLILAGGSVVLVGVGVVHYAMHGKSESRRVALVPSAHGGLITWTGGF